MAFNERLWLFGRGITPEWEAVKLDRISKSIRRLKIITESAHNWKITARDKQHLNGIKKFILSRSPLRNILITHPCFDHWLHLWSLSRTRSTQLEMKFGKEIVFSASTDLNGRFYFYGTPYYLQLPGNKFPAIFKIRLQNKNVLLDIENGERISTRLSRISEIIPGICTDSSNWLLTCDIAQQDLATLKGNHKDKFIFTLKSALADIEKKEPSLYAEMLEMLHTIIPLTSPSSDISVSSSYSTLRGAIALSPSEDILIQAETLIHEHCHQKINQLLPLEPMLLHGQSSRIFYSPWRTDARHLRGILLGAHAFLNVARYLAKTIKTDAIPKEKRFYIMSMMARRIFQTQDALQTLSYYGSFTEFGRRFLLGCWKELGVLRQGIERYPADILKEQKKYCANHRKAYALPGLGIHKGVPRGNVRETIRR